jgi:hypothetical protein
MNPRETAIDKNLDEHARISLRLAGNQRLRRRRHKHIDHFINKPGQMILRKIRIRIKANQKRSKGRMLLITIHRVKTIHIAPKDPTSKTENASELK